MISLHRSVACSCIQRNRMSSPLTLIVLGQAYFLGTSPLYAAPAPGGAHGIPAPGIDYGGANGIAHPGIDQPMVQNERRRADYTYTPGIGSHKVHTTVTSWIKAIKICQGEGAHLAVINSRAEADAIARVFATGGPHPNSYSPNYAWIGTHDLVSQEGDYETIFGQSLADAGFEEWHEAKSTDNPFCGAAFRDGTLSWFGCSRLLGFICELPDGHSKVPGDGAVNDITKDATTWIRESLKRKLTLQ